MSSIFRETESDLKLKKSLQNLILHDNKKFKVFNEFEAGEICTDWCLVVAYEVGWHLKIQQGKRNLFSCVLNIYSSSVVSRCHEFVFIS